MTTTDVAALDQYRDRRTRRLRESLALHSADPKRREVSRSLAAIAAASGADRIAVVHVDGLDGSRLQTYLLMDLLSARPRREWDPAHVAASQTGGVPGFWDQADGRRGQARRLQTAFACALGSDGSRTWHILADAVGGRKRLDGAARDELFFHAGRCAAVLLHTDLADSEAQDPVRHWPMLQDLTGREDDQEASRRIASRFVVVRAVRAALDDGGAKEQLLSHADACQAELTALDDGDPERRIWTRIVDALKGGTWDILAEAMLSLGSEAERLAHFGGAEESYALAYDLATYGVRPELATDATRFRARVFRRQGRWAEAEEMYGRAQELAKATFDHERLGLVLSGMASVSRAKGNLPRARELLMTQLEIGRKERSSAVVGSAYHDLMTVDKESGDLENALVHGWNAVRHYEDLQSRLGALADVAGVLTLLRALSAAEDAYAIVAARIDHRIYRIYALDGLAHIAALRGDAEGFAQGVRRVEAEGMGSLPEAVQVELLYYRGVSYQALGNATEAAKWYSLARVRGEEWGVNKVVFDAEAALHALRSTTAHADGLRPSPTNEPREFGDIRDELRTMREELVGV